MTLIRLPFNPRSDGFAFDNSWRLNDREQAIMSDIVIEIFDRAEDNVKNRLELIARASGVGAAAVGSFARLALGRAGDAAMAAGAGMGNPLVAAAGGFLSGVGSALGALLGIFGIGTAAAPREVARTLLAMFIRTGTSAGFCGGMTAAALDYLDAEMVLPRGRADAQPQESDDPAEAWLRRYIFDRLCDSLRANGPRFLEMQATYHLDDDDAAQGAMRAVTRVAVDQIIADIDAGKPCGVGLVTASINPEHSHQVVCYGYERHGADRVDLLLYDCNRPDQDSVLIVQFGAKTVSFLQPDTFLGVQGNRIVRLYDRSGAAIGNPGWCSILYLDYAPKRPAPAIVADSRLSAEPQAVIPGNKVTFSTTLRKAGYGDHTPGNIVLRQWDSPIAGAARAFQPDNAGAFPVAFEDRPAPTYAKDGRVRYDLGFFADAPRPNHSAAHVFAARGLDHLLILAAWPNFIEQALMVANNGSMAMPSDGADPIPAPYAKRLTAGIHTPIDAFVRITAPHLELISPDIGDRCDPAAFPGKTIRIVQGPESQMSDQQPAEWLWTIAGEDGSPRTQRTTTGEIEVTLPKSVGARVVVTATVRIAGQADLSATISVIVNDEAGAKLAGQICAAQRQAAELEEKLRLPPAGKSPDWVMQNDVMQMIKRPGMQAQKAVDMLAARVRLDADAARRGARGGPR